MRIYIFYLPITVINQNMEDPFMANFTPSADFIKLRLCGKRPVLYSLLNIFRPLLPSEPITTSTFFQNIGKDSIWKAENYYWKRRPGHSLSTLAVQIVIKQTSFSPKGTYNAEPRCYLVVADPLSHTDIGKI